jgi:hypothetical protein
MACSMPEYSIMQSTQNKLLSCSICGSELDFHGKDGAILRTKCPGCGISSDSMIDIHAQRNKNVEVYYRGRAPMSTEPGNAP